MRRPESPRLTNAPTPGPALRIGEVDTPNRRLEVIPHIRRSELTLQHVSRNHSHWKWFSLVWTLKIRFLKPQGSCYRVSLTVAPAPRHEDPSSEPLSS